MCMPCNVSLKKLENATFHDNPIVMCTEFKLDQLLELFKEGLIGAALPPLHVLQHSFFYFIRT